MPSELKEDKIQLREFTADEVKRVFELSNDKFTRENSYSSDEIVYEDHVQWFSEKLNDENFILFIAEYNNEFVGQVKFDIDGNEATIGISITPDFRGRKLGSVLINKGIGKFTQIKSQVKIINAFIKKDNIPSTKIFERTGFSYLEDTVIKGAPSYKYIFNV